VNYPFKCHIVGPMFVGGQVTVNVFLWCMYVINVLCKEGRGQGHMDKISWNNNLNLLQCQKWRMKRKVMKWLFVTPCC